MSQIVLLVHHGTVDDLDDMPAFLRNVRRGREAPAELVREMRHRYEAIGSSPLHAIAGRLAAKLEKRLGGASLTPTVPVRAAARLWHPYAREVLAGLDRGKGDVVERVVVIPLAQHSADVYVQAARADLAPIDVVAPSNWGQTPALIDAYVRRVREAAVEGAALILSAHSLPKNVPDAYEREVRTSAEAVAHRVRDLFPDSYVAFQSQGAGALPNAWLGPSLEETLDRLAATGRKRVVVAPIGFLADHVEILYDLDIEAKALATARGLELTRTPSLNDDDDLVAVIEGLARGLL